VIADVDPIRPRRKLVCVKRRDPGSEQAAAKAQKDSSDQQQIEVEEKILMRVYSQGRSSYVALEPK